MKTKLNSRTDAPNVGRGWTEAYEDFISFVCDDFALPFDRAGVMPNWMPSDAVDVVIQRVEMDSVHDTKSDIYFRRITAREAARRAEQGEVFKMARKTAFPYRIRLETMAGNATAYLFKKKRKIATVILPMSKYASVLFRANQKWGMG